MFCYNSPVFHPLYPSIPWTKAERLGLLPPPCIGICVHPHLPHDRFGMVCLLIKRTWFLYFQNLWVENFFLCICMLSTLSAHTFSPPTPFSINANTIAPMITAIVFFPESTMTVMSLKPHFVSWSSSLTHSLYLASTLLHPSGFPTTFWAHSPFIIS